MSPEAFSPVAGGKTRSVGIWYLFVGSALEINAVIRTFHPFIQCPVSAVSSWCAALRCLDFLSPLTGPFSHFRLIHKSDEGFSLLCLTSFSPPEPN